MADRFIDYDGDDWNDEPDHVVFQRSGKHVARKRHTCTNCYHDIEPGMTYFRSTALVGGDLIDEKWHSDGQCKPYPPTDESTDRQNGEMA